jgi:uncharacterized protein (DUF2235 family)
MNINRCVSIGVVIMVMASASVAAVSSSAHPKRLVLCLDGTWNNPYDEQERIDRSANQRRAPIKVIKPSNPLKLCRAVLPVDSSGREQIAYYDTGVGSMSEYPGVPNRLLHVADRALGGVWAAGFEANVEEALHFLVVNYQRRDQVFVFGFSRGAATARGVTRFLEWNQGLPQKGDAYFLPRLFQAFVASHGEPTAHAAIIEDINGELAADKKDPLQPFQEVRVTYLGVWDTVMALGSRFAATGKDTSEPGSTFYAGEAPSVYVQRARQALAIDEHRYDFRPEIWTHTHPDNNAQRMEQRWFSGVHSNIGGGYMHDGLANIAFHWILEGATDKELGDERLQVDDTFVGHYRRFPLDSIYDSSSLVYRIGDAIRFRTGKGKRSLVDRPDTANLTLDASVIKRMRAKTNELQPTKPGQSAALYRPQNVLQFLACQDDLDTYLTNIGITDLATNPLPDDVKRTIADLRRHCAPTNQAAGAGQ